MKTHEKVYRTRFQPIFRTFLLSFIGIVIVNIITTPLKSSRAVQIIVHMLIIFIPVSILFAALCSLLLIKYFPVYISTAGLRSYNFWGAYQEIRWADCQSFKVFQMIGLPYLSIKSFRGKSIIISLSLSNIDQFHEDIKTWAGVDHPIVKILSDAIYK